MYVGLLLSWGVHVCRTLFKHSLSLKDPFILTKPCVHVRILPLVFKKYVNKIKHFALIYVGYSNFIFVMFGK